MKLVLIGALAALVIGLAGTRWFITVARRRGWGQFVRDDGPTSHHTKHGTPQMGGIVIITGSVIGYALAHLLTWSSPTVSGSLVLFLMVGIGLVGFLDDWTNISRERSLGLRSVEKLIGQTAVAAIFAVLATKFSRGGISPASYRISFVRDTWFNLAFHGTVLGVILFVLWASVMIAGTSNGVKLTDGLDGLAAGGCVMVFGAYVLISIWQFNQRCQLAGSSRCYDVRDPLDLAVVAASIMGACIGFLWWNAAPARIFMGDTGSLGLGGALAGLAIMTRTELLVIVLGGLFVLETLSVILQVSYFKLTKKSNGGVGKRLFRITRSTTTSRCSVGSRSRSPPASGSSVDSALRRAWGRSTPSGSWSAPDRTEHQATSKVVRRRAQGVLRALNKASIAGRSCSGTARMTSSHFSMTASGSTATMSFRTSWAV